MQVTCGGSAVGAEMNNQDHKFGLAISTPIPRADAVKNACSAPMGQVGASPATWESDKAQESAPQVSLNPRPSIDGLPCATLPGAHLTGGGISNRSQSFSFQSGHGLSHKLASSFPSQVIAPSHGLKP